MMQITNQATWQRKVFVRDFGGSRMVASMNLALTSIISSVFGLYSCFLVGF
jgi:hypothetical protein